MLKVIVKDSREEAALHVAKATISFIRASANPIAGFSAGKTQIPVYKHLCQAYDSGTASFGHLKLFDLDEYLGFGQFSPFSFAYYFKQHFVDKTDIHDENVCLIDGASNSPEDTAAQFEKHIKNADGIGLQLLSLGANGHIGFNEPGTEFSSRTHIQKLSAETLLTNRDDLPDVPPQYAITLGIGTILEAGEIIMLVTGRKKASMVNTFINGPISAQCPASALRLHKKATVVLDLEAAHALSCSIFL
jgi:glucosamine-6-phosphate deaminase